MAGAGNPPGRKSGRGGKLPLGGASQSERTPAAVKARLVCLPAALPGSSRAIWLLGRATRWPAGRATRWPACRAGRLTPTFVSPPGFCKPILRGGLTVEKNGHPGQAGRLVGRADVGWSGLKPPRLPGAPGGRKAPAQRQHPEPRVWWRQSGEDSRAAQPQRFSVLGQPCVKDQLNRSCPGCRAGRGDPGGRGRVQTGLWSVRAGSVWRAALGCLSPEPKNPLPRSGLGEYASAGTQQARVRKQPTGAPGWGSCDWAAGESSGWAWVEGPLQTTNTQPHTVSLPLCHDACGAGSRRPRRSSPDVPGSEARNRAPVGPRQWAHHGSWAQSDGPRHGCPAGPGRPPRPLREVRGPGLGPPILQPALPRWAPARVSGGPGEASPAVPRVRGPGRALPRWAPSRGSGAPARVSGGPGEASPAVPGVRGPGSGPAPMGPIPGVRGGFPGSPGGQGPRPRCPADPGRPPRPSRGPGAPGRALPRWAPSRVSGEASQAVPGVRGPGSGPAPMGPVPGVRGGFPGHPGGAPGGALPRWAPAQVSGPRVGPCPDGPRPGCPRRIPRPSRGSGAPGRALPSSSLPCPAPMGPGSGGPSQPALPRWAPAGPTGTPPAPRAKAECVQMAALRARPSGLTDNPGHLVALRADLLWRVQMAGLPRKSR
ncbi:hypothetical protein NDU88_007106 [Pleurodeles waltl]|uniref:Collagen alpha-1(I) chain-like n=1 Tax=Pleurodeles waltl TaxID=8319 RepID=A0AAV7SRI8_PLEWA|nr:hypothetical protein NDU88_007106 [Pleurodeles waltl]